MVTVEAVGWAGTVTGTLLGLPQAVRLARTRNVEGLSLRTWQALLAVNDDHLTSFHTAGDLDVRPVGDTDPDGTALPGHTQHENCAIHCAGAGSLPGLALALVALLFPLPRSRRTLPLFSGGCFDLLRAGLGSRAPPLPA